MKDKLKAAVYGFAVGDALGVPYEFKKRDSFECTDMIGFGTWNQPEGTWSDDTSMTLATLESLKQCDKEINPHDMQRRYMDWFFDGEYTANGDVFDIGNTTREALINGRGIDEFEANGNGSLMRVLPLAFVECEEVEVNAVSAITHAHAISEVACVRYVGIAKSLFNGENLTRAIYENRFDLEPFDRLTRLKELTRDEINSTGYVVDTLEAALWCLLTTDNYKDAVLRAVNLGGDTDTIAAVTGGLAGIMYGYSAIPDDWIAKLRNKKLIDSILKDW